MRFIILGLCLAFVPTFAAENETTLWKGPQIAAKIGELGGQLNEDRFAVDRMGDFGSHAVLLVHREGNGPAEMHEDLTDFYVVQQGEGSLVTGGKIVGSHEIEPGEFRGTSIDGGRSLAIKAGDIVNIPPGVSHQVVLKPGQKVTYVILKVARKEPAP